MSNQTTTSQTVVATPSEIEVIPTAAPLSKTQFNYQLISNMLATAYEKVRQAILTINLLIVWVTGLESRLSALEFRVYGPMDPNPQVDPPVASPESEPQAPVNQTPNALKANGGAYDTSTGGLPALKALSKSKR